MEVKLIDVAGKSVNARDRDWDVGYVFGRSLIPSYHFCISHGLPPILMIVVASDRFVFVRDGTDC